MKSKCIPNIISFFTIIYFMTGFTFLSGMAIEYPGIHISDEFATKTAYHPGGSNYAGECDLEVDFEYKITDGIFYFEAHTNTNSNTTQFIWDMGDGTKLKGASVYHQFTQKRDYKVCLTVLTSASATISSCTETICKNVNPFNGDNPCGLNPDFKFEEKDGILYAAGTSSAGDRAVYIWKISDGTQYKGKEFKHAFKAPGTYEICLTVVLLTNITDNKQCSETICRKVKIDKVNQPCNIDADIKIEIRDGVLHATGISNAGDRAAYFWKISDGTGYSGKEIKHQFRTPGEYEVCLTVALPVVAVNDIRSCSKTVCQKIKIDKVNNPCGLTADFKIALVDGVIDAVGFSNAGDKARYYWRISDGSSYNGKEFKHKFKASGTYEVCLTVLLPSRTLATLSNICSITICKKIDVRINDSSDCPIQADFDFIKRNSGFFLVAKSNADDAVYKWIIGDSNRSFEGQEINIPMTDLKVQKVCLIVYSKEAGCSIQVCREIDFGQKKGSLTSTNPFTDWIGIQAEQSVNAYILYDQYQHIIKKNESHSGSRLEIETFELPAGIYYLQVQFEDGTVEVRKLVKL